MEALDTRLRRRIDTLRDELDAANEMIAKLQKPKRARASDAGRATAACPYCGCAIRAKSKACPVHVHLMADDPFYAA